MNELQSENQLWESIRAVFDEYYKAEMSAKIKAGIAAKRQQQATTKSKTTTKNQKGDDRK